MNTSTSSWNIKHTDPVLQGSMAGSDVKVIMGGSGDHA